MKLVVAALSLGFCLLQMASAATPGWILVKSSHFEVYSQAGESQAKTTLAWVESLRAFFISRGVSESGADLDGRGPVRVIGFASAEEYTRFRTHPDADAFFLGGPARDYLVMPQLGAQEFGIASHEYAHLVLRSLRLDFPPWLAEGIAEFFSTVHIGERDCSIGGDLPARSATLRQNAWIALPALLAASSPMQTDRRLTNLFYAESWALTDMLMFSPAYAPHFSELLLALRANGDNPDALVRIYGKTPERIQMDVQVWIKKPPRAVALSGIQGVDGKVQTSALSKFDSQAILADLLLACGKLDQAEDAYRSLSSQQPHDASVHAALGNIALRKNNPDVAREEWKLAIELGSPDARLCYQYAILAEDAAMPPEEIRAALEKAISLDPRFDDARYKLGLLEANADHYQAAIEQLLAIQNLIPSRRFVYWVTLASAYMETGQRDRAKNAAAEASRAANTSDDRAYALGLADVADTDLTVQLTRDANGNTRVITARKPHGSEDWNPFIEPEDRIQSVDGQIRNVECIAGKITGFLIASKSGNLEVSMPDPTHVLIRGGNPEFFCGSEDGRKVLIEYAEGGHSSQSGILRGMLFR